jgi:hypothetical protein
MADQHSPAAPSCRKKKVKQFLKENGCRSRKLVSLLQLTHATFHMDCRAGQPGRVSGDLPRGGLLQAEEDEEEEGRDDLRGRDAVSALPRVKPLGPTDTRLLNQASYAVLTPRVELLAGPLLLS